MAGRDSELMISALRAIGAGITVDPDGAWRLTPIDQRADDEARVDVGNAGTVLRFTPPVAALGSRRVSFDGDEAVRRRPVGELLTALRAVGGDVASDRVPFVINGKGRVGGGWVAIDASASSQLVSGLLLSAPRFDAGIEVVHVGARSVPNAPHVAMSVAMLRERGVAVDDSVPGIWRVEPGPIRASDQTIEPDLSSAAPLLAAAVATHGTVRMAWPGTSTQPGRMLPDLLQRFGATVDVAAGVLTVRGGDVITGVDVDLRDAGELAPVVAALATLASTPSRITGIDYLRGHETDRLAALARELSRLGASVTESDDGLAIVPKPLRGSVFSSYDDHRMVMAAAVIGLVVAGIVVDNPATVAKTFPEFLDTWERLVQPNSPEVAS